MDTGTATDFSRPSITRRGALPDLPKRFVALWLTTRAWAWPRLTTRFLAGRCRSGSILSLLCRRPSSFCKSGCRPWWSCPLPGNGAPRLSRRCGWRPAESNQTHRARNRLVGHEPAPNISGQQVLRAEQTDSHIDPNHVAIEPLQNGVVSIYESVAAIDAFFELVLDGAQSGYRNFGREHQRAGGGAGGNGSVHGLKSFDFAV